MLRSLLSADCKLQRFAIRAGHYIDKQDPAQRILHADSMQTASFNERACLGNEFRPCPYSSMNRSNDWS
eukprot:s107_g14.t1